jgi:hypothetical protein
MKYNLTEEEDKFLMSIQRIIAPNYRKENLEPALNFKMNPRDLERLFILGDIELQDRLIYIKLIYQKISEKIFGHIPNEFYVTLLTEEESDTRLILDSIAKFKQWIAFFIEYNATVVTIQPLGHRPPAEQPEQNT